MKTRANSETPKYKVGDYLYSTWGYEQTNVNFYRVVGVTAKCVKIVPVKSKVCKQSAGMSHYVTATDERDSLCVFDAKDSVKRVGYMVKQVRTDGSISLSSYARAYRWHGEPVLETFWY